MTRTVEQSGTSLTRDGQLAALPEAFLPSSTAHTREATVTERNVLLS